MTPEEIAKLPYRPCAGVCLTNPSGLVWVGQRIDRPKDAPPAWQMPQGGIDPGETPLAAAKRELLEETGLSPDLVEVLAELPDPMPYDLPHDMVARLWKGRYRGQMQHWVHMRYEGPDDAVDLDYHIREFSEWAWMPAADVVERIVPFKRDIYVAVFDAFGLA
jgi:putative (di)nucleoside polyphosphate hydrolase